MLKMAIILATQCRSPDGLAATISFVEAVIVASLVCYGVLRAMGFE
jgi:hypothetical protein